ncbi:MAG: ATPase domain-containing protein [Candidatus Altiarchaeota archaeon]
MHEIIKTGIPGLDGILGGGIPRGHTLLLSGSCGTGKTILCEQFLFNGARDGEPGVYIALSEPKEKILKNVDNFKFYDQKLMDNKMVQFVDITTDARLKGLELQNVPGIISLMRNVIEENKAKRVVLDSITHLAEALGGEEKIRDFIFELGLQLSYIDTTMVLISEIPPQKFIYSVFGVEEFIADGVILLTEFERKGDLIRALQVIKMRGVDHSRSKHILKITEEGVNLIPLFKAGMV